METSSYSLPVTREEGLALLKVTDKDRKWLESVFANPIFLKALRRLSVVKPSTVSESTNALSDVRALAEIRGWNKFEKALLLSHNQKELEAMLPLLETYDNPEE